MAGLTSPLNQDDVNNFMAFTNTFDNPEVAKDYLMNNNNDISKAIDEWYRLLDPNHYKNRLVKHGAANQMQEVNPWTALAGGSSTSQTLTQPTTANQDKSRPPSRPPSRAHDTTEWEAWGETDPGATVIGPLNNEDALMQEALERSRLDQKPTTSVAPKILDPDPKARMRKPGQPAFLKPLPDGDFLPALLTILQSVPNLRNELLSKDKFLPEYRWNEHWWEGELVESARVLPISETDHASRDDILHETQLLIAFLEDTTRAYGNVEPLLKILARSDIEGLSTHEPRFVRFLKQWEAVAMSDQLPSSGTSGSLFQSNVNVTATNLPRISSEETAWRILASSADIPTTTDGSLYDAVDNAVLGNLNQERSLFHEEFPPVLIICLEPDINSKSISVPDEIFVDRYLTQNWDYIKSARAMAQEEMSHNDHIISKIGQLETFKYPLMGQRGDALKLMSTTLSHLQYRTSQEASWHNSHSSAMANHDSSSAHSRALPQLAEIEAKLQSRLKVLNEEKQSREERIRAYSRIGTLPDEPQFPARHRYVLRGVSTNTYQQPSIYALHASQDEPNQTVDQTSGGSQWWKMIYDTRFSASVRNEPVTIEQVLQAAGEMASSTLLVYIEDEFLNSATEDVEIPTQLKNFVEQDNAHFYAESQDPFMQHPAIELEGVPVDDGKGFDWSMSDSDTLNLENGPGPSIEMSDVDSQVVDPTRVDGNDVPAKLQEFDGSRIDAPLSPKKRKKHGDDEADSSDLETMAPDSDLDLS